MLSEQQLREIVDAVSVHGSARKAAKALGMNRRTVDYRLKQASERGLAPGHTEAGTAPGFTLKYLKIHRDERGGVKQTWECQIPEAGNALSQYENYVEELAERVKPLPKIASPQVCEADLLTQYTFTDYHLDQLAWHGVGGDDWDLDIAWDTGVRAMSYLTNGSPPSHTGVVLIQGDWHHADSLKAVTPTNGHILDRDSRAEKAMDVSMDLIEHLVTLALKKHKRVILMICEGNHDEYTSMILRKHFKRLFRKNKRVEVPDSNLPYYAIEWGKTALFYHHGHLKKWGELPLLFAAQFPEIWGRTTKRYGNTGHFHHEKRDEFSGIKMIQHPTMTARDAYAARGGWISEREMTAMTFHKEYGRGAEMVVTPEMVFGGKTS